MVDDIQKISPEDEKKTPSFDARMEFSKVIGHMLELILEARVTKDRIGWLEVLRNLYDTVNGFLAKQEREAISAKLKSIQTNIEQNSRVRMSQRRYAPYIQRERSIYEDLSDVNATLCREAMHVIVGLRDQQLTELNIKDFKGGLL